MNEILWAALGFGVIWTVIKYIQANKDILAILATLDEPRQQQLEYWSQFEPGTPITENMIDRQPT